MIYSQLPQTYKYDTIADAIYAREVEYFHYDFDRLNFEYLLVKTDGEYRENIQSRLADTGTQMRNVLGIIEALQAQIDDEPAYAEAVERAVKRREEQKNVST